MEFIYMKSYKPKINSRNDNYSVTDNNKKINKFLNLIWNLKTFYAIIYKAHLIKGYSMKQLTEKQSKIIQIILGLVAGIGIWFSILVGSDSDNGILQYLFVIIFAAVMLLQRFLENKFDTKFRTFSKFWLIGLIIGLVAFLIYGFASGTMFK